MRRVFHKLPRKIRKWLGILSPSEYWRDRLEKEYKPFLEGVDEVIKRE